MKYTLSNWNLPASEARRIALELETVRRQSGGSLTAKDVVNYAKNTKTALHSQFDWNDSSAAYKHRLRQARNLIQKVVVKIEGSDLPPTRAFVSVRMDEDGPKSFTRIDVAMRSKRMRDQLLEDAKDDLQNFRRRYAELVELAELFKVIDDIVGTKKKIAV